MRGFLLILVGLALLPLGLGVLYRWVDPPFTPLMVIRLVETGTWPHYTPVRRGQVSRFVGPALIAAEDNLFCVHNGFDWEAIDRAMDANARGDTLRGASTISQQVAKNLFLWPGRNWLRKGLEVPLTAWLEFVLPKRRILELYMDVAEWGPGVYGVEEAARRAFGVSAKRLTAVQAARLAAVLPSPLKWNAARPGPYVLRRTGVILRRVGQLGGMTACVR